MTLIHGVHSPSMLLLQFRLDMCQASLLAEGNLMGRCWETGRNFEACAMRKIKT
jgi:hypothetical protein